MIAQQDLEQLRSRVDIVQVIGERIPLKKSGANFKGLCPFHAEKSPSFMVHPEKQIFHCFGCGAGGDVFSFLMKYEGVEFIEAVEQLAERFGIILTKSGQDAQEFKKNKAEKEFYWKLNRLACRFYYQMLQSEGGKKAKEYLQSRGVSAEMVREFLLGYAPADGKSLTRYFLEKRAPMDVAVKLGLIRKNADGDYFDFFRDRLLFSILPSDTGNETAAADFSNLKILGFSGRALNDEAQPKYLNSPESSIYQKSASLLGAKAARPVVRETNQVILVEGNFDLLRLHQEGMKNVVAPLGTALTEAQIKLISRWTDQFVLLFDGDAAGLKAADRALSLFLPLGISPKVVSLPAGEDPDSFVRKQGIGPLKKMVANSQLLLDARIERILQEGRGDVQAQVRAIKEMIGLIELLPTDVEKSMYYHRVAQHFGISEELLKKSRDEKNGINWGKTKKGSNFLPRSDDHKGRLLSPIERTILEILLSGHANPGPLFQEIKPADFGVPALGELWQLLRADYEKHQGLDVARILGLLEEGELRSLLVEMSFSSSRWLTGGNETVMKAASDCVRQFRVTRMKGRLKELSLMIRRAEAEHDQERVEELLGQKNGLIKEMTGLH